TASTALEEHELVRELTQNAREIGHIGSVLYSRAQKQLAVSQESVHYSAAKNAGHAVTCAPLPMLDLEAIENILVVMLDHLGDVLLTFPAIERLREMFPLARIAALVGSWSESLMRGHDCVDEVLTYDFFDASSAEPHRKIAIEEERRIESWLSGQRFDLAVDFRREPETRDFLRLSRARYTAGFCQGKEAEWLTVAVPSEPNIQWVRPRRHV